VEAMVALVALALLLARLALPVLLLVPPGRLLLRLAYYFHSSFGSFPKWSSGTSPGPFIG